MRKNLLNQTGFSLVEVMIGVGIAAGIGVMMMRNQENANKIQGKVVANQDISSAVNILQTQLSNRAVCSRSLAGKKPVVKVPGAAIPPESVVPLLFDAIINPLFNGTTVTNEFILKSPHRPHIEPGLLPGNKVRLESMRLISHTDGKDYLEALFNVNPTGAVNPKAYGGQELIKRFPILSVKDPVTQVIISCYSEQSNLVGTAVFDACKSLGGTLDSNKKCIVPDLIKKSDLIPLYLNGAGVLTSTPPENKAGEQTCQKNPKKCSRTSMNCSVSCPSGQFPRNEREWDRCQSRAFGACVDWACMKTVDCMYVPNPIGHMVKP